MTKLRCSTSIVARTLDVLREAGQQKKERVILWLSPRGQEGTLTIVEVFIPRQNTAEDYFHIPPQGMQELMAHLRNHKLSLRAQVHSHPEAAFHSKADDKWAIVRHVGAISIVVPYFASGVSVESFMAEIAMFCLSGDDRWTKVATKDLASFMEMI